MTPADHANTDQPVGEMVVVAVGSRSGEIARISRVHYDRSRHCYVWLEPLESAEPLGYYSLSEIDRTEQP